MVADGQSPKSVFYPRNPELDPQLVWQGKDQQDAKPLEIPVVPIYIQEKIHPQAIIEDFRRSVEKEAKKTSNDFGGLFADFNGLPEDFDQRVDFYHHDGHWSNRMILGDSLMVMSSLAEKEGLKGKVQMIYFDSPYGIKFGSNWQVSTRKRDVKDGKAEDMVRHAYFTGAGEPYEKLKRALRAEVDESALSALYATRSRPFDKPPTGEIAIKVINHYGDEVLKVCAEP